MEASRRMDKNWPKKSSKGKSIQWEFQDPKMEVPTIYKAYARSMYGDKCIYIYTRGILRYINFWQTGHSIHILISRALMILRNINWSPRANSADSSVFVFSTHFHSNSTPLPCTLGLLSHLALGGLPVKPVAFTGAPFWMYALCTQE